MPSTPPVGITVNLLQQMLSKLYLDAVVISCREADKEIYKCFHQ